MEKHSTNKRIKSAAATLKQFSREWELSLQDLEQALGIGITVHDPYGRFCFPTGEFALPGRHLHPHAICARHTATAIESRHCAGYCQHQIQAMIEENPKPFISYCWRQVSEVVVPILYHNRLVLILFAGPFQPACSHAKQKQLPNEIKKLPLLTKKAESALIRILHLTGTGIWSAFDEWSEQNPDKQNARPAQIRRFLYDHAHEEICLEDLAANLYLSPSRAGHLVVELFEQTFRQLLTTERINRAKALLQTTSLPLQTVATRTGFATPYYFSRVFHESTGMTPTAFRNQKS